jgi:sister-chromatid-cohesion protein PDS5
MPKNVLSHLAEVLIQVIDEADVLPSDMVDVVLAQFLPRNVKANPTSVQLAVEVCNQTNEKLQRYVAQYFTEVLSPEQDEDDEGMDSEEETTGKGGRKGKNGKTSTSKADAADFILTHDLIKSITRSCPALLANVIPLLEEELVSEDKGVRILATQTLGEMFSDRPADKAGSLPAMMGIQVIRADLAKKYPKTWRSWLGRSRDKEAQVRLAVLECTKDILAMHHELGRDIYEVMHGRLVDPDDKIRAAACAAFSTVDYESALHAFDKSTLKDLAARMQDKRVSRLHIPRWGRVS